MKTSSFHRTAVASTVSALVLAFAASTVQAQASSAIDSQDWAVFVDPPTRFAFVKAPSGRVFVRLLDEEQLTRLPASTLLTLLKEDDSATRYAHPALEPSPRVKALRHAELARTAIAATPQWFATRTSSRLAAADVVSRPMAVDRRQVTATLAC